MASAGTVIQVCRGALPCYISYNSRLKTQPQSHSKAFSKYRRQKAASHFKATFQFPRVSHANFSSNYLGFFKCGCQRAEGAYGLTSDDTLYSNKNKEYITGNGNLDEASSSKGNVTKSGTTKKGSRKSLENEAWELLKESVVYYCGSPVGTIAAKDTTASNVLNYDQVFIRDFIPSGIAFLLKGEYEIIRSFILHTLQLQLIYDA